MYWLDMKAGDERSERMIDLFGLDLRGFCHRVKKF